MTRRNKLFAWVLLVALFLAAPFFLPWAKIVEPYVREALGTHGIEAAWQTDALSFHSMAISEVHLRKDRKEYVLDHITFQPDIRALMQGNLVGEGTLSMTQPQAVQAKWSLNAPLADIAQGMLTLNAATLQFSDGTVTLARPVVVPLAMEAPIILPLNAQSLSLKTFLSLLSGKPLDATGMFGGAFSLTVHAGQLRALSGNLGATGNGVLKLPPDMLSGSPQLAPVATMLSNLEYDTLTLNLTQDNGKQSATLNIEGKNPDYMNGRLLKFKVRVGGDVLPLAQDILKFSNPEELIHE